MLYPSRDQGLVARHAFRVPIGDIPRAAGIELSDHPLDRVAEDLDALESKRIERRVVRRPYRSSSNFQHGGEIIGEDASRSGVAPLTTSRQVAVLRPDA
jgi:hypothetical protein